MISATVLHRPATTLDSCFRRNDMSGGEKCRGPYTEQRDAGSCRNHPYRQSGQTSKKPSGRFSFFPKYSSCFTGAKFFPHF